MKERHIFYQLNGFLAAFVAAGVVFFSVCLLTKTGRVERKSLDLFFHPSLNGGRSVNLEPAPVSA